MSTKTTFKRIALVAVASLGFGVLTSVTPASAAVAVVSGITAGTAGPTRVGVATTVNFTVAHAVGDTFTVTSTLTSKPALSTGTVMQVVTGTTSSATLVRLNRAAADKFGNATVTGSSASATVSTGTAAPAVTATTTTSYVAVTLTPDVAGDYQILLSTGNASFTAGDKSAVITIGTVGAPATATMTTIRSQIATGGTHGSPIKIVLKDANGAITKPNATETINLTVTSGSATLSGAATIALAGTAFASGSARTMIKDAVADDVVVVSTSGGGTLAATTSLASTLAMTSSKTSATAAATAAVWQQGTGVATTGFDLASTTSLIFPSTATSQSIGLGALTANGTAAETTATATKYTTVTVTDTDGGITDGPGAGNAYDIVVSQAGGGATITSAISVTATLGTTFRYSVATTLGGIAGALVVTGATPTAETTSAISPAVVNSALAGVNVFTAKVTDQFGSAIPNYAVTATVSAGRNATKPAVAMVTDAAGLVSYTLTDTGTTGLTDTVTFTGPTVVNATINYGLATVSTATLTGGNTTAGVTATTVSPKDISAGDGAELGAQTFTVTVKDVNGALLAGLPVVWTVSGTTAAITSTSKTGYTTSVGTDSASVYAWATGTYTVTATVGGVAATGTITFAQLAKGEERTISATVSGPIVTAKTVDRFGNPVPGVTVYATKTGAGYFGAGVTKTSGVTATDGTVEFVIAGGSADVTVSTIDYAAAAGSFGSGQTSAPKGYLGNSTTAAGLALLAITASAAGTTTLDEEGVGASFDAAGVASVLVAVEIPDTAQAASDAAAEATDAANAATDAANAAAEAADAATAAAQDAADAVAALATSVEAMVNALKKQITALTNLVIKIQKKVKA